MNTSWLAIATGWVFTSARTDERRYQTMELESLKEVEIPTCSLKEHPGRPALGVAVLAVSEDIPQFSVRKCGTAERGWSAGSQHRQNVLIRSWVDGPRLPLTVDS
jgi:hypothetical protein